MTPEISKEWKEHQSPFARDWLVEMRRKGKEVWIDIPINQQLRAQIGELAATDKGREAMLKDVILIEAALVTDRIIVSLDTTVRRLFAAASGSMIELKSVVWVNPEREEEQVISWLKSGAKQDKKRRLGS